MRPSTPRQNRTVAGAATATTVLRHGTADLHAALEARLPLLRDGFTRTAYVQMLARLYVLYAGLEDAVAAHAPELDALGLTWERRRKLPALRQDLAALRPEGAPRARGGAVAPGGPHVRAPRPLDVAAALGCIYVTEGSTLGGRVLAAHFQARFGFTAAHGAAFFHSYGAARGRMWRTLTAALDGALLTPRQQAAALAAARATFLAVGNAMAPPPGPT